MRRHGNLWAQIISLDNIRFAHEKAIKGKSKMKSVIKFNKDIEGNLVEIKDILEQKTFTTSKYHEKTVYEPKKRIIYVLPFSPDRIVQHALMNVLEPILEKFFIYDSYACRTGKGVHAGSRKTMEFVRRNKYVLKCDISKFYPSVDQDILFNIVKKKIKCPDTLWLISDIIYSFPGGKNVPIGNYTSQWLGYRHFNNYILLRKSTTKRMRRRLGRLPKQYTSGRITAEQYRSSVGSTWGWLKHANSHNLMVALKYEDLKKEVKNLA